MPTDYMQPQSQTLSLNDQEIYELFSGRCANCSRRGTEIHEIRPRSRGRSSMLLYNRVVVCHSCHTEYHRQGASKELVEKWQGIRDNYLTKLGKAWTLEVDGRSS